jgi:hypothetical protein
LAVTGGLALQAACGGGSSTPPQPSTYTVTITAKAGSVQQTTTASLTVQLVGLTLYAVLSLHTDSRIEQSDVCVAKSRSLRMSAVSSILSSALPHSLREERHFALVDDLRFATLGSLLIVRVKNSVQPSQFVALKFPGRGRPRTPRSCRKRLFLRSIYDLPRFPGF